jgi:hypothetical protein
MTPAMNPGMKGQPQAGLAALAQPAQAPRGMSSGSMQEIIARARQMSDSQLADILSGKSMAVPQYVAMTEAMGRKSLRTAMQGAQAQQQAKQPSLKDRMLAEDAQEQMAQAAAQAPQMGGISNIPAPNMESVDMASGGIVAFQDNEDQPVRLGMPETDLTEEERKQLAENPYMRRVQAITNPGKTISEFFANRPSSEELFNRASKARRGEIPAFVGTEPTVKGKLVNAGLVTPDTPIPDVQKVAQANLDKRTAFNAVDREEAAAGAGMKALSEAQQRQAAPKDADQRSNDRRAALANTAPSTGITPEKRTNPFGQLSAELPDYEKVKNQGLGEAMMAMSGALFGNRNISAAMAQGLPTLAKLSGATRKEVRELKKDYNAQQLNLAKANELFAQGQEDLGFKYLKQSQDHAYHMQNVAANMMQAGKPAAEVQLLQSLQKPGESLSDTYARTRAMQQDPKSNQALQIKHADYMKSPMGMIKPLSFDEWMKQSGYGVGDQQVAGAGNQGYSVVYGPDGKRI